MGDKACMRTLTVSICLTSMLAAALVAAGSGATSRPAQPSRLVVASSPFGQILFDGRRKALYAFTKDPRGRSVCSGACAKAWPPFIVRAKPGAGPGVRSGLIGISVRADGRRQATYRGRPLYYYVGDRKPGQVLCQNVTEFGGTWLVMRASGRLVRG